MFNKPARFSFFTDGVISGISDADSEARSQARKAFWGFADHFPKEADRLLLSLDVAKQRLLHNGTNGRLHSNASTEQQNYIQNIQKGREINLN